MSLRTMLCRHWVYITPTFVIAVALGGPADAAGATDVPAPVVQAIAAQHLPMRAVSFAIVDPKSGRVLASFNGDTPRSPASTIKVVTTFASLDLLGPAYVWQTRALIRGNLNDGVLDGDLVLQGGGDPYMTLERWWKFVRMLRDQGLKAIRGDVVIDNTAFSLPPEDPGAFDGRPNRSYNALPDALMINFQSIDFRIAPNADAHQIQIVATPAPVNLVVENHIGLAAGRCSTFADQVDFEVDSQRWDRVVFSGVLSQHCAQRSLVRVLLKAPDYAFGTFVELWRQLGGQFGGKMRIEAAAPDDQPFLTYDSVDLGEVIRLTNKFSNNLMARHLFLTLGKERYGAPGTLDKGVQALAEWARERALDLQDIEIDNGSGLSRTTHISALQMARVLGAAYHSRYAPEFIASLPVAGVDGTMKSRMRNAPAGSVRLKTGHLDDVSGVAGYVKTPAGKTLVLVSLINDVHANDGGGEPVHAAIVAWMQDNL
ncbi:MAG: D-alanyl-D-alanine carboxypeptidase/D-alanyl-D-alanine-endopeptidase [Steroidobacteraceae bacterium]